MRRLLKACIYLVTIGCVASAHASLLETSTYNNIVYLADDQSRSLNRYSLPQEKFLPPISLAEMPQAVHADSSGIYLSYGLRIVKLTLAGTNASQITTTAKPVKDIEASDQYLLLSGHDLIQTLAKSTGQFISSFVVPGSSSNISLSADNSQIFSNSEKGATPQLYRTPLASDGALTRYTEINYYTSYSSGDSPVIMPNQNRIVDNRGAVYNTADLTFAGSLGDPYTDIGFYQELPIVLRGNSLYTYNQALLETGVQALPTGVAAEKIAVYANKVFAFSLDATAAIRVNSVAIASISPADPAPTIDPTALAYTPDSLALDRDQSTVYLLSKAQRNIFRWSIDQSAYLQSIPLAKAPLQMSYSAEHGRIYLSYSNGAINYIDLADNKEHPFAALGEFPHALTAAGPFVIAKDLTGAWGSLSVFNKEGIRVDHRDWIEETIDIQWDNNYGTLYFLSQSSSLDLKQIPLDITSGLLGKQHDEPYYQNNNCWGPIRSSESGKFIALGCGRIVDRKTLAKHIEIDIDPLKDMAWLHGNLFTLNAADSDSHVQLQRWAADFSLNTEASYTVAGVPVGLIPVASSGQLLVIYGQAGIPQFELRTYKTLDFDKDGHFDGEDALPTLKTEWLDTDDDDIGNNADTDDDGDGVSDTQDAFPLDGKETLDTDKDGIGNNADSDDDGDGILDIRDQLPLDATESADLDNDGIGDNTDTDVDGDGALNSSDAFPRNPLEWLDTDQDGVGNNADTDDDNDGILDGQDALPLDAKESKDFDQDGIGDNADSDIDNDQVPNSADAFPFDATEWLDSDKDGISNNRDTDNDNDGVLNTADDYPFDPQESKDSDYDGIGDNADPDKDGDGVLNSSDAFPLNFREWSDTDKDGLGNNADNDDDNDGVMDNLDFYPLDASKTIPPAASLLPLTTGNSWLYDTSSQPVVLAPEIRIANESIKPLQFPSGGKLYLKAIENQIQLFGFYIPQTVTAYGTYKTDVTLKEGIPLLANNRVNGTGNVNIDPKYGNKALTWNANISYLGRDNIQVHDQQYSAIHTRLYFSSSATVDGALIYLIYSLEVWFAENVGIVKIIENGTSSSLVSATILEPAAPDPASDPAPAKSGGGGGGSSNWLFLGILLLLCLAHKRPLKNSARLQIQHP